jgi:VIT1/CCC1 family predicted Fe2+/Mn2+ transporter
VLARRVGSGGEPERGELTGLRGEPRAVPRGAEEADGARASARIVTTAVSIHAADPRVFYRSRYIDECTETRFPRSREDRHIERHRSAHIGWLRAAVLGANDGLISTASLILGVAASHTTRSSVLIAGVAGLVAGSMSMAAGEYVSVSSQADTEGADLALERRELAADDAGERAELAAIYVNRGLTPALAAQVAEQLMAKDALGAHAHDELGMSSMTAARPLQAALASAVSFALGALLPVLVAVAVPQPVLAGSVTATSLVLLSALGALAAWVGGASLWRGALRVVFWGALAMGVSAVVGRLFGAVV